MLVMGVVACMFAVAGNLAAQPLKEGRYAPKGWVMVPGGTFTMGSPAAEVGRDDNNADEIQHEVTLNSFYIGEHEVTQAEYQAVMNGKNPSFFDDEDAPVEYLSWFSAVEYCNKRSAQEGLTPAYVINKKAVDPNNESEWTQGQVDGDGPVKWSVTWKRDANGYRLPTEAEWEYACRAKTTTAFNTGASLSAQQANFGYANDSTLAVGSFAPNAWQIYDMHGNVAEWCWDWYGDYPTEAASAPAGDPADPADPAEAASDPADAPATPPSAPAAPASASSNPTGAPAGAFKVVRGGSWATDAQYQRSAYRGWNSPSGLVHRIGFRVVRSTLEN
jgi:formylglycine-generating enzyme required for sulfatase activity